MVIYQHFILYIYIYIYAMQYYIPQFIINLNKFTF